MHNSNKNPPWARSGGVSSGVQQQMMGQNMTAMSGSMMTAYPQQQMYQQGLMQGIGMGMTPMSSQQMYNTGVVSYPTPRALNPNAFQGNGTTNNSGSSGSGPMVKQRVFTGTVTKAHKDFGFVDEDVFFQMAVCGKGSIPKVGDRVLVEASYNANMPFKWNATRIQVMANSKASREQDGYNAVPPPSDSDRDSFRRNRRDERRRDEDEPERKRVARRDDPPRRRESPVRRDSPLRRTSPVRDRKLASISRFDIHLPKVTFDTTSADVFELKRRYRESAVRSLYVPSDFFTTRFRWQDAFPLYAPLALDQPAAFHILHKSVEIPHTDKEDAVLEPADADYSYSAKVMLLSLPSLEKMYEKCNIRTEKDGNHKHSSDDGVHPTRLIKFLVGNKGKNSESFAIGGPWSPSLDGPNPEKNPATLVKTAIRTCKALTGIDLSKCTQWYRFVEYYYRRCDEKRNKTWVETVVLFVPDVWSCVTSRLDWDVTVQAYKDVLERKLTGPAAPAEDKQADKGDKAVTVDSDVKATSKKDETDKKDESSKKVETAAKSDFSNGEDKLMDVDGQKGKPKDDSLDGEAQDVVIVSETPAGLSDREKRDLKSRYTLPDSPHVLVHPSSTARGGKFQAAALSLSVLLDYRIEDAKEHSFEVFLFAELFNEMLMRDFIFNIYKALTMLPDKEEEKKDKKKSEDKDSKKEEDKDSKKEDNGTKEEVDKSTDKKDDKSAKDSDSKKCNDDEKKERDEKIEDEDMQVSDGDDEKRSTTTDRQSESRRGRKRRGTVPVREPLLLMSFLYFDITRAGHITSGDMEKMLSSLGLQLSRAQIKKLLAKVLVKDNFYYKRICEAPREGEPSPCPDIGSLTTEALKELALGNRCIVPITNSHTPSAGSGDHTQVTQDASSGMVTYAGRVVDLDKLLSQLASSEATRRQLESRLIDLKKDNKSLQDKYQSTSRSERNLTQDLDASKVKLTAMQSKLKRTLATTSIFHSTMKDIQTKIDAVISIPFQDDTKPFENEEEKPTLETDETRKEDTN